MGTLAVQIASWLGAHVTAVTRTESVDMVRALGADEVVGHRAEDFTRRGERYDVLFDIGGNRSFADLRRVLARDGTLVTVGGPAGRWLAPASGTEWGRRTDLRRVLSEEAGSRMDEDSDITALLIDLRGGDRHAVDRLFPLVYDELRQVAHRLFVHENTGHTLQTTALVHESYLRLVDQRQVAWTDRAHFFPVAAMAMRRILVDYARRRKASKRGSGGVPLPLDDAVALADERAEEMLALSDALTRLATLNERLVRVVECRFFGGLTAEETAAALGVTARTTAVSATVSPTNRAYPRSRGDHFRFQTRGTVRPGLPPLARGPRSPHRR